MERGIVRLLALAIAIQALCILPAFCGDAVQEGGHTVMYIYDITKQPANADGYDEVAALASMQGIINRDKPLLYIDNGGYGRPKYWLEIMSKDGRWLEGVERKTLTNLDEVYRLAGGKLKGAVIWDPEVPASINVATTIAGVEDTVIFSPGMAEKYRQKWNLAVIIDLRGMFTGKETGSKKNDAYRWAIRQYIDSGKCSPHFLCLYTDSFYDREPGQIAYLILRDWAVKNRAFTFDLSPWGDEIPGDDPHQPMGTDLATYQLLLAATLHQSAGKQMTEVAGFFNFQKYSNMPGHPSKHDPVPTEWETVYLISPYNCYQNTATEFCYNQSFHCHAPRKQLKQSRPSVKHPPENKSYIAILMADYDSAFPLYNFLPNHWNDKVRGELPLAWGINPNLIETYPDVISYFYETATPKDNFVADASAAGYMNPNRVQQQYLPLFIQHNQNFYTQADMTISGMVLDWDEPRDDVKDAFTQFSPDGYATIVADLHGGAGKPPRPHVWKGMPIVQLLGADPNSPEYTAGEIYKAVKQRQKHEPGFYCFRCVWVSPSQVQASLDLFAKQHPEEQWEVVDLYTFFDLFKAATSGQVNYARPFEPPTRPAFIPLPPGAVEPVGWLRDWCLAARDGYTGHMDEYDDEFQRAWAADHTMTGEGLLWYKGAWPYEGGGYWFDGLTRLGYALHDDALIQQARRRLYAVADHMHPNGLLFLWWLDRNKPDDRKAVHAALEGWPLWACGQLGRAMVGYYAGSGDKQILKALETAYSGDADCLRSITGNMSNPWPAFDTYAWTGNKTIADALTAMFDKERPGLKPNLNRYRTAPDLQPGTEVENQHVVEFLESTTPWAVGYLWTGEASYLQAALGWHDLLERIAMQPNGVPVSDEWYGPTGAFRGTETCDVAGYVWSQMCLLAVSGEGRLADRAERAFFNAGPATVSRDFKTHVYFQSPNRFADGSPDFPHGPRAGGGSYQPKHSPLCCTAALNRIVPYYVTHMWMATYDNGLAATCYGPCKVTALAADRVPVEITCHTDYPFNETIEMSVQPAKEAEFAIYFHIPGWCANPALSVNGSARKVEQNAKGFACVSRSWKPGDTVRLHFPMTALVQTGRDNNSPGAPYTGEHKPTTVKIPEKDRTQGAPYASVSYGPLLFSLAIPDTKDANTPDPSARWKFALDVQNPHISVERQAMPTRWNWPLESPLKLKVNAVGIDWNPAPEAPGLPALPVVQQKPSEEITLIPFGCTKFRISMFPVTANEADKAAAAR